MGLELLSGEGLQNSGESLDLVSVNSLVALEYRSRTLLILRRGDIPLGWMFFGGFLAHLVVLFI